MPHTHRYYIRTEEPYFDYSQAKNGEQPVERIARHPFAVIVAEQGSIKVDDDDELQVMRFGVAICNRSETSERRPDVFDKEVGVLYATKRLRNMHWHPERGHSRMPMGGWLNYVEGEHSHELATRIMTYLASANEQLDDYYRLNPTYPRRRMFSQSVRRAAMLWLEQHPEQDEGA